MKSKLLVRFFQLFLGHQDYPKIKGEGAKNPLWHDYVNFSPVSSARLSSYPGVTSDRVSVETIPVLEQRKDTSRAAETKKYRIWHAEVR
jgi:hypothetical protein